MLCQCLPLHGIQVVKKFVGHMGADIIMQQDDAITECTIIIFFFKSSCVALEVFDSNSLQ